MRRWRPVFKEEGIMNRRDFLKMGTALAGGTVLGTEIAPAHTGDNAASAHEQLRLLREEGVSASAWIWVHANSVKDSKALRAAAEQGAWLEFDGISPETTERHLELVRMMKGWGRLGQTLLSHDGNSYRDGKLSKPYDALFRAFIPALRQAGFNKQEVRLLTVENPRRAFAVAPRLSGIGR
jgi:phosphotriesterase-related protein